MPSSYHRRTPPTAHQGIERKIRGVQKKLRRVQQIEEQAANGQVLDAGQQATTSPPHAINRAVVSFE